jgi:hypothetical protein
MGLRRATPAALGALPSPIHRRKSRTPAFSFRERGKHEHRNYGLRGEAYRVEHSEHYHLHTAITPFSRSLLAPRG